MKIPTLWHVALPAMTLTIAVSLQAKGLDELTEENPENAPDEQELENQAQTNEHEQAEPAKAQLVPSDLSKKISGNLFLAPSVGWVKASRAKGKWNDDKLVGISDLMIAYRLPWVVSMVEMFGTYRYCPIAVSGEVDNASFRGVWESHNFGGLGRWRYSDDLTLVGSAELSYVLIYLTPLDDAEVGQETEANGIALVLGGGADYGFFGDKLRVGPRINLGFGGVSTIQVAAASSFLF
jgi:hypothetical protein